jgi:ketosteroid isomerase-like protein
MRLLPALLPAFVGPLMLSIVAGCATTPWPATGPTARQDRAELERAVRDTERAFAATMADRDHAAFMRFLSAETVFFAGSRALRGRDAVASAWKPFYEGPVAPFSWAPETVEVLDSGQLALSSGPVHDPAGKRIASFTSIWRQEAPGVWRIVFDKGCACSDAPD